MIKIHTNADYWGEGTTEEIESHIETVIDAFRAGGWTVEVSDLRGTSEEHYSAIAPHENPDDPAEDDDSWFNAFMAGGESALRTWIEDRS